MKIVVVLFVEGVEEMEIVILVDVLWCGGVCFFCSFI